MKKRRMNRAKIIMITEALTDYLAHSCDEKGEPHNMSIMANDHFEEFVLWAYDDILISKEERDLLLNANEWVLIEYIKERAVKSYGMVA
jgi:hypothetical protein